MLNVEAPDLGWVTRPDDWMWQPGALEGLLRLSAARRVSVVTNQSCVGRGLAERSAVDAVHAHMIAQAEAYGARIDAVFVCPHAPGAGCACRKPEPGLLIEAMSSSPFSPDETLFVGDSPTDLAAGRRAGVRVALVRTGKGQATASEAASAGVPLFADLDAVADFLGAW